MKKQILFLTFFVAAILVGMNANAQYDDALATNPSTWTTSCITPTTLTCFGAADALHPIAGVDNVYTITSTDAVTSGNEKVHWFVIDNADMATAGGIIATQADMTHLAALIDPANGSESVLTATPGVYNVPVTDAAPNTTDAITISWNYFDGQTQVVLLVAYVYDAVNCTDNIEVYRIFPQFQFTLDIAAIDQADNTLHGPTDAVAAECVSPIESAVYAGLASPTDAGLGTLTVNYGENYAYFMVNAANYTGAWNPLFDFAYDGVGTITDADWTYPLASNDNTASVWKEIDISGGTGNAITDATSSPIMGGGGTAAGVANFAAADLTTVGAGGECIIVRVRIDHGISAENTVLKTLTVTVDGTMYNPPTTDYSNTALEDFGFDAVTTDPCIQADNDDLVAFNITPRPNVITTAPTPFELNTGDNSGVTPFTPVPANTGSSTN